MCVNWSVFYLFFFSSSVGLTVFLSHAYCRLPIGDRGGARKEARIPQPWRLQVALPAPPCRRYSFLRMDLHRNSLIQLIRYKGV